MQDVSATKALSTAYKTVLYAVDKLIDILIDSATYLLTISLPDIDNVAMSLCDIENSLIHVLAKNIIIINSYCCSCSGLQ